MIECIIDGHVALITLNNPAANTFTAAGLRELTDLIGDVNRNLDVYAAVITGRASCSASKAAQSAAPWPRCTLSRSRTFQIGAGAEELLARPVITAAYTSRFRFTSPIRSVSSRRPRR